MRVLVTRPQAECERTARAVRERGHDVLLAPLLRIEPNLDADIGEGPWSAIALTSANAVEAIAMHAARRRLLEVPVFAVGARTAAAVRSVGFAEVQSAEGDVSSLAEMIGTSATDRTKPVLYLAGEERARDLHALLAPYGFAVETVPVYRAVAAEALPPAAHDALAHRAIDAVLHFSRRTAQTYLAVVNAADLRAEGLALRHLCLSAEIAAPLIAAGAGRVTIAPRPDQQAMLDLLDQP
ncbi:MAG: uroporphyrinogen-III synthase [Xanthobacteraceae bacterium]